MQEVGDVDANDDEDCLRWKVQTVNTLAVDALVRAGYDGELLRATLNEGDGGEAAHTAGDEGMPAASF